MKFSCMVWPHSGTDLDPVIRLAQSAEACGFETCYIGDSQMIWNDVWVALGACATATSRIRLGTGVTNMVTRHPAVTANAAISVNMLSKGRMVLGVGAGDSAVRTAGLSPAKLPQIRERIQFMRSLLSGEEVDALAWGRDQDPDTWGSESKIRIVGAEEWGDLPIQLACMGPRSVRSAGEICDGVIVDGHMGGNAEGVEMTIQSAEEGAKSATRSSADFRYIAAIDAAIDDDRGKALAKVKPTAARNIANKPWLPATLGVEHADVVKEVTESYKFYQHLDLNARHQEIVSDEVAMKCCIAGTPEDCVAKGKELKAAGINEISLFITSQDEAGSHNVLNRFAKEVFPNI